mmetsp:Transcript_1157/g.3230  ORF Transcript_1157/g.3230 Transcript_1157/m.3230 type:complete len:239 (-) Transcript_1157:165-881(-)
MCIEEENDHRRMLDKPSDYFLKVITTLQTLLLPRQDSGSVNEGHALENRARHPGTLQPAEETVSKGTEWRKGEVLVVNEGIPRDLLDLFTVANCYKSVSCRFRTNLLARVIILDQMPDERGLPCRVLAQSKNQRPRREIGWRKLGRVKHVKATFSFDWQQLFAVEMGQSVANAEDRLLLAFLRKHPPDPAAAILCSGCGDGHERHWGPRLRWCKRCAHSLRRVSRVRVEMRPLLCTIL